MREAKVESQSEAVVKEAWVSMVMTKAAAYRQVCGKVRWWKLAHRVSRCSLGQLKWAQSLRARTWEWLRSWASRLLSLLQSFLWAAESRKSWALRWLAWTSNSSTRVACSWRLIKLCGHFMLHLLSQKSLTSLRSIRLDSSSGMLALSTCSTTASNLRKTHLSLESSVSALMIEGSTCLAATRRRITNRTHRRLQAFHQRRRQEFFHNCLASNPQFQSLRDTSHLINALI